MLISTLINYKSIISNNKIIHKLNYFAICILLLILNIYTSIEYFYFIDYNMLSGNYLISILTYINFFMIFYKIISAIMKIQVSKKIQKHQYCT